MYSSLNVFRVKNYNYYEEIVYETYQQGKTRNKEKPLSC